MSAREDEIAYVGTGHHAAARPMRVVTDRNGYTWLCDAGVDEKKRLTEQGCWRCDEVPFTRHD